MRHVTRFAATSTALLTCFACSQSTSSNATEAALTAQGTSAAVVPGAPLSDPHQNGQAEALNLAETMWGRLVDVYAEDPASGRVALYWSDLVIGANVASDGVDYELRQDPVTLVEELTILHPAGSAAFDSALDSACQLVPILPKAAGPLVAPPFSAVPRNAAVVLRFDDLVAAQSAVAAVRVLVGDSLSPFEARVFADANHGVQLGGELYSTRLVVDFTTTEYEALKHGLSSSLNAIGLPEASEVGASNVTVQIGGAGPGTPTLKNAIGQPLSAPPTQGIVRAFRSGLTSEPYNGFLPDNQAPSLLAVRSVEVAGATQLSENEYSVSLQGSVGTAGPHWLRLPGAILKTSQTASSDLQAHGTTAATNGSSTTVRMTLVAGSTAAITSGAAQWIGTDVANGPGFQVLPEPSSPPLQGASVASRVRIWLSEPTLAESADLEGLTVLRENPLNAFDQQVIGSLGIGFDQRELTFVPTMDLAHVNGQSEGYTVAVDEALTDLAGNAMSAASLGTFTIASNQPTVTSGGLLLTFNSVDENGDGNPEITGNHLYDLGDPRGSIVPRPVTRFSSVVDGNRPIVSAMQQFQQPIQTPHVPLGSKMHTVWRMYDLGLGLLDRTTWDIDVEGLNWSPFGGSVIADSYAGFEMRLGHSAFQPDEALNQFLLPQYPLSGIDRAFGGNYVDPANETVVHPAGAGYSISPADTFLAATGTPMIPWPMNQGKTPAHFVTYTWRDTAIEAVGAPNGQGVDILRFLQLTGIGNQDAYPTNLVPSIGLPLLMEFRCQPDPTAIGVNGGQIALGINSSARPFFRTFSSGGFDVAGQPQTVDPDNEPMANGGFSQLGNQTPPSDNAVQFGQADFVIRVSRTLSAWFDTASQTGATFSPATINAALPEGTSATLEFRGATNIVGDGADANTVGAYGNQDASAFNQDFPVIVAFLNADDGWKPQASDIDGARYFQFRLTQVSNIASLKTPRVGVVAVPFMR